jgi:guanylate kinase
MFHQSWRCSATEILDIVEKIMEKAHLFVISGPSAVGKSSIVNRILEIDNTIERIVTCTTRRKRTSEKHGRDYLFLEKEDFLSEISKGNLIEFSEVYGNYYGITLSSIEEKINAGRDSILVINWEGFLKIKNVFGEFVYGIFVLPPSIEVLRARIQLRGEDSPEVIERRISMAMDDIEKSKFYDFCWENFDITASVEAILAKINHIRKNKVVNL